MEGLKLGERRRVEGRVSALLLLRMVEEKERRRPRAFSALLNILRPLFRALCAVATVSRIASKCFAGGSQYIRSYSWGAVSGSLHLGKAKETK